MKTNLLMMILDILGRIVDLMYERGGFDDVALTAIRSEIEKLKNS